MWVLDTCKGFRALCMQKRQQLCAVSSELGKTRTHVVVETDASTQVYLLGIDGSLFRQKRGLLCFYFTKAAVISVCSRICNQEADSLATFGAGFSAAGSNMFMSPVTNLEPMFNGISCF